MFKSHVKSTIQKAQAGIAFIIFAALLSQAFNVVQYVYTRRKIQQQTVEKTYNDMAKMQNIVNLGIQQRSYCGQRHCHAPGLLPR